MLKILLHIIFFLSGIATILIGPVLPILAQHFTLNDLQVSFFFPAQFAGSLSGTFLPAALPGATIIWPRRCWADRRWRLGVLLMNVDSFAFCLFGFLINGLGVGLTLPSINMMILEVDPDRSASA